MTRGFDLEIAKFCEISVGERCTNSTSRIVGAKKSGEAMGMEKGAAQRIIELYNLPFDSY